MTSSEIRNSFLKYFENKSHTIVSSAPVIPYEDPTLLFTNAGMNQFKDVFLGAGKRSYTRAADTQKCIRVSGKHNDLEEVGRDTYHHTFFEMLGNWSFGDYYKKEAIEWAWELLTKVWNLPKNRLWVTVYKDDEEAESLWKSCTDIDHSKILRFGEKENFWEMGETGPCGPCSEIHIDRTPNAEATEKMVNAGIPEVIEIWNLVFIQYNRDENGKLNPLPAKHVDTGMGFERICAVIQNKSSNYDTDVFLPIINAIAQITQKKYNGSLKNIDNEQYKIDTAMRVIADHVRTLTFAIGDGAAPSNEGRGYVLRRLLRRAARFGRNLGMKEPFIYKLVTTIVDTMSYVFPEIKINQSHIQKVIKGEEESFNATLDRGLEIFEDVVKESLSSKIISGANAFKLYDTFGFPLDLTELMASERNLNVDVDSFNKLMNEQKERSREFGKHTATNSTERFIANSNTKSTNFVGYNELESTAKIIDIQNNYLVLDKTPCYAESGGQVGDTGILIANNENIKIVNTEKDGDVFGHKVESVANLKIGDEVKVVVDKERRMAIARNHSATHLLHNALRRILGSHVQQAGSLVSADYLRFDFSHYAKLSKDEIEKIENLVNEKIKQNIVRTKNLNNLPFEDAKKLGALMFFGDKYGDRVNVIQFGDFSTEFCGGTHVNNTLEIGFFKIKNESSIASGVRRIEAVTNISAIEYLKQQFKIFSDSLNSSQNKLEEIENIILSLKETGGINSHIQSAYDNIKNKIIDLKSYKISENFTIADLYALFKELANKHQELENVLLMIADMKKSLEKKMSSSKMQSISAYLDELISKSEKISNINVVISKIDASSVEELKSVGDALRLKLSSGVGLLISEIENKAQIVCVVTDNLVKEKILDAGKIVKLVAQLLNGGGGGKPHLATAGGKDVSKIDEAIIQSSAIIKSFIK